MSTTEQRPDAPALSGIPVTDPATGRTVGHVTAMTDDDVAGLARVGRAAQPAWDAAGFEARANVLRRARRRLLADDRIIHTIVAETGKPEEDAQLEVAYAAGALGFWAAHARGYLQERPVRSASPMLIGRTLSVRYRPLPLVGVIGPWNYPLINSFGDCIPALAAGCSVILKPSHVTPLTSLAMAELMADAGLPGGVFQVATGHGGTGAALIDHVDFVMFTGSTETGRRVMARAAETLTPVGLELGGKDPMIVLADADLERAANGAVFYSMVNAGQTCVAVERVYAEAPVYEELVERVGRKVAALRQGVPAGPGSVDVGAIIFEPQIDLIESQVEDAVARGARVVTGGRRGEGPGRFYAPTVLADVDHSMRIMTEETFGPTLPIMRVTDAEQAIRLANDSPYGLSASVWTRDVARGRELAGRLEAGSVSINDAVANYYALEVPMGGWKASGLGTRHGADGIRKYCAQQTLLVSRLALRRLPYMYPYRATTTRLLRRGLRLLYGRGPRE